MTTPAPDGPTPTRHPAAEPGAGQPAPGRSGTRPGAVPGRGGRARARQQAAGGRGPAPAGGRRAGRRGTGRRRGPGGHRGYAACVRGRFRLSEVPGVTVGPVPGTISAAVAATAAYRALGSAGLGHLGGRLELRTTGAPPRSSDLARAARRAVAAALAGPHPA